MIRKLRTKLVAAAMLSLLAVLTVILGVILLTNYRGIVSDADRILDLLADNQGKFPEIKADFDWEELGPRHRSVELGYETRYFSVLLDRQGTVLATDTGKIAAVDEETAASYAQAVRSKPPLPSSRRTRRSWPWRRGRRMSGSWTFKPKLSVYPPLPMI